MSRRAKSHNKSRTNIDYGELRIIGGQWKRTKLSFPLLEGVRPTPSRVRETIFNWLAADIQQSVCVDLFAGSGALGFEALSRGAEQVWFVDSAREICHSLKQQSGRLSASAEVIQADAMTIEPLYNRIVQSPDIIFCDPPFRKNLIPSVFEQLADSVWLETPTLIYIETESELSAITAPTDWQLLREKKAGDVIYRLYSIE